MLGGGATCTNGWPRGAGRWKPRVPFEVLDVKFPAGWYDVESDFLSMRLERNRYVSVNGPEEHLYATPLTHEFVREGDHPSALELEYGHCLMKDFGPGWRTIHVRRDLIPIDNGAWVFFERVVPPIPGCFEKAEASILPSTCGRAVLKPIVDPKRIRDLDALLERASAPSNL
jgi:hypothetical protein